MAVKLEKGQRIKVAKLPEAHYPAGFYLYVGRAKRGLRKRVDRHLRRDKKNFWHIDYFLREAGVMDVWIKLNSFDECRTVSQIRKFSENSGIPQKKFGASDCRCPGHLVYLLEFDDLRNLRKKLKFERIDVHGIPILDIKPYTSRDRKSPIRLGWLEDKMNKDRSKSHH